MTLQGGRLSLSSLFLSALARFRNVSGESEGAGPAGTAAGAALAMIARPMAKRTELIFIVRRCSK